MYIKERNNNVNTKDRFGVTESSRVLTSATPNTAGNGWGDEDRAIGAPYHRGYAAEAKRVKQISAPTAV